LIALIIHARRAEARQRNPTGAVPRGKAAERGTDRPKTRTPERTGERARPAPRAPKDAGTGLERPVITRDRPEGRGGQTTAGQPARTQRRARTRLLFTMSPEQAAARIPRPAANLFPSDKRSARPGREAAMHTRRTTT